MNAAPTWNSLPGYDDTFRGLFYGRNKAHPFHALMFAVHCRPESACCDLASLLYDIAP